MLGNSRFDEAMRDAKLSGATGTRPPYHDNRLTPIESMLVAAEYKRARAANPDPDQPTEPGTYLIVAEVTLATVGFWRMFVSGKPHSPWLELVVFVVACAVSAFGSLTYDFRRDTRLVYASVFSVTNAIIARRMLPLFGMDPAVAYLAGIGVFVGSIMLHRFLLRLPTDGTRAAAERAKKKRVEQARYSARVAGLTGPNRGYDPFERIRLDAEIRSIEGSAASEPSRDLADEFSLFTRGSLPRYLRTHPLHRNLFLAGAAIVLLEPLL